MKKIMKLIFPKFVIEYYRTFIKVIPSEIRMRKFYSKFIKKGNLCFDIGANDGNRISPLLRIGALVLAVEPQDKCVDILNKKFKNRINIVKKGVGEKNELRDFYISQNSVLSTFSNDFIDKTKLERFSNNCWDNIVKVEIVTLDDLVTEYGKPHFVKIDVEGFELEVLKGLHIPIDLISFEFIFPEFTDNAIKCINRLNEISTNYVFNYSANESMKLELDNWLNLLEIIEIVKSMGVKKCWGDIYAKLNY